MNYKNIINISLLIFSFYLNYSYGYDLYLGTKYHIMVDKKLSGVINTEFQMHHDAMTKQYDISTCNYKITFFQHNLVKNNNLDSTQNINQDVHSNIIRYQKEQSFLTDNLTYKSILPLEWDFFNCFQAIQNDLEKVNNLTIDLEFQPRVTQKSIIFKICDLSFNFYLSNSRINFLIFSNIKNVNFISMNQSKYNEQEVYENISLISKITILNIASVSNNNLDKSLNNNKLETSNDKSYNGNTISRSSKVISMSEDKTEIINKKQAKKKSTLHKNKTMNSISNSRNDQDILSILNKYCNTKVDQNCFFLLGKEFIKFLVKSLNNINNIDKDNAIMLINPLSPAFIFDNSRIPQIKMFNIYILYLDIEALDDKKGFIVHFYPKENFLNIDLCTIKKRSDFDFLTLYIDETEHIRNITIKENEHIIEYELDPYSLYEIKPLCTASSKKSI